MTVIQRTARAQRHMTSTMTKLSLGLSLVAAMSAPSAIAGIAARTATTARSSPTIDRPNIIMLMTDDQRLDDMSVMPKTRRLIGGNGVTFSNAFVSYPLCCPSRATYFTGQYSHNNGVLYNRPPNGGYAALRDKGTTFPVSLQRAGYDTIHMGKYLNGAGGSADTIPPGWSDFRGAVDPTTYNYYGFKLNQNGSIRTYPATERYYRTDLFARMAEKVIRREAQSGHPFFLNIAFLAPHSAGPQEEAGGPIPAAVGRGLIDNRLAVPPHRYESRLSGLAPPEGPAFDEADVSDKPSFLRHGRYFRPFGDRDRADIAARYRARLESLMAVDDATERIVRTLRQVRVLHNTVIMFTSDNGFFYGEHRIRGGKYFVYDPAVRVPLLIRGPGIARDATRTQLVGNIDLAPTILALAHARPLRLMDGRSLLPLLPRGGESVRWNRALLLESGYNNQYPAVYHAIRTERYEYVEYNTGDKELYDMQTDPDQLNSRHNDPQLASVMTWLQHHLAQLRTCHGRACR